MDFLKSKNTLNLLYNYDREHDTTNIYFDLKQDNTTFTVSKSANVIVNYYNLTDGKSNIWQVQRDDTGRLYSNVKDFKDINHAGKYSVVVNVDGMMFPSQGQTIFNIEEKTTPIGTHLIVLKGDAGEAGEDGVSVKNITISENGDIVTTLSDNTTRTGKITLPDKLKGADGKDAPSITGVHFNQGQTELIFDMSDSSEHIATFTPPTNGRDGKDGKNAAEFTGVSLTPDNYLKFEKSDNTSLEFKMPNLKGEKGDKGEPGEPGATGPAGQAGKDAPTISNVTFSNNSLTFNLSDGSKQSVTIPTIQGPAGENGQPGKDAAKITGAKFNADQTQIIFSLSDGTSFTTNFIPPKNGTNGTNGKDAANFTDVTYSNNSLIFTLSDGKTITATLPDLKGKDGTNGKDGAPGKDAPTITAAKVENGKLTFTFSDGTSQSADLPNLEGKSITGVKLHDKSLVFTLSDNSNIIINLSSIIKPDLDTHADAGTQIFQAPSSSTKPTDGSVNAIISTFSPTLLLNYKNNPLKLTYDKTDKTLNLIADKTGHLQSYKIDFSPIFDILNNFDQQKLSDITFSAEPQKVVLQPNSNQNFIDVDFDVNKNKSGQITKGNMHKRLIIDTTQLTSGTSSSEKKTINLLVGGYFDKRENPNLNSSHLSESIKAVIVTNIYVYKQNSTPFISCELTQNDFKFNNQTIYNSQLSSNNFDKTFSFAETYLGPDLSFSIPEGFDVIVNNNRLILKYGITVRIDKIPEYPSILPGPYELRFNHTN